MKKNQKNLVTKKYVTTRALGLMAFYFWLNVNFTIFSSEKIELSTLVKEVYSNTIWLLILIPLVSLGILYIKPIKKIHENYLKKHLNDERKQNLRYKIYFYAAFTLVLFIPVIGLILKSTNYTQLNLNNLGNSSVLFIAVIVIAVELIIEKI
ncbi:hypothetical protein ACWOFR_17910 [Carnobacterium gallinarum]|uniref:hypothetical protein n=1 Tax=Carnobacterium gallinarum TaxID=2749 RepID=UPI000557FF0E|nr:hypothetical protein [Carnobacterium gallinarum]